jgi:hypothetical protein
MAPETISHSYIHMGAQLFVHYAIKLLLAEEGRQSA